MYLSRTKHRVLNIRIRVNEQQEGTEIAWCWGGCYGGSDVYTLSQPMIVPSQTLPVLISLQVAGELLVHSSLAVMLAIKQAE